MEPLITTTTVRAPERRSQAVALDRLLKPRTVAFVGLRPGTPELANVAPTLDSDAEVFFVSRHDVPLLGRTPYRSLADIGKPIDAVFAWMSASRTAELAEQCADLDVGGMVLVAGAFAELGDDGAALQQRLVAAAERGGMAMVGPNGLGYVNVTRSLSLTLSSQHRRRRGGLTIVSQSGSTMSALVMAAWERSTIGINAAISAGNEAATDLADYVDYLATDDDTSIIALVIETIRRPEAFFAAVRKAAAAGKPVVALKLARNSRTQQMAASHTGALTGDSWVYDIALGQAGVISARDPEELIDRIAILAQVDPRHRRRVDRVGVITLLGGIASLAYDIALDEGVEMPEMTRMAQWISTAIPGVTVANPLDATGLAVPMWPEIIRRYADSDEIDALLFLHPLEENDDTELSRELIEEFIRGATTTDKPFVLANVTGALGAFALDLAAGSDHVIVGHGVRPSLRGLHSLGEFSRADVIAPIDRPAPVPAPAATPVRTPQGPMLPFAATMELLARYGIPVADYAVIGEHDAVAPPPFAGPYVVKLADVAHRTEIGAVRLNVPEDGLPAAVTELRHLAARHHVAPVVAIQPMVDIVGECIVGIQGSSELGPVVVLGLGGVLVEVIRRVHGRLAPLRPADAQSLIDELADLHVMHGFRGAEPWDLAALADILVGVGNLACAGIDWIASLDVNPLVYGRHGFVAVDGLCMLK